MTHTDAVRYIEEMLGADGSRELAEAIVARLGWRDATRVADEASDAEWGAIIDAAAAEVAS